MRRAPSLAISAVIAGAFGCGDAGLSDPRFQTGSQAMTASSDYDALYVANVDHGTVSRVDPARGETAQIEVGAEPTRVARAKDRVFVTLRGERAVAVLLEEGASLTLEAKIPVGAEPYGVVAREDGTRVYVASSISKRIDEIDAEGLTILRSWTMPVEPRWVALHPSGDTLYVASPFSERLYYVPLGSDDVVKSVDLPDASNASGRTFTARITGDMAVAPDGYSVAVPALYVDNMTPIDDTIIPAGGYYGGGRLNPVAAVVPADNNGEPIGEYAFLLSMTAGVEVNGYPASMTFDPSAETVYGTVEGGGGVVAVQVSRKSEVEGGSVLDRVFEDSSGFPFNANPVQAVKTVQGPRSVVFLEDERAFTYGFLDNSVQDLPIAGVKDGLSGDDVALFGRNGSLQAGLAVEVADAVLPEQIAYGRRLFYRADDPRIAANASGLSCATCHFDGRNDGLTWTFNKGLRQTPSLAGMVSMTEPVRWAGDRETVQEDALRTSKDAMGGGNLGQKDLDAIAAYIDFIRDVDIPREELDAGAVARGKAIFERPDVACATCHNGPRYTNNTGYDMFGMRGVQTRSLNNVSATAPYFHDGSAATLMDVVEGARDGSMGNTSMLSDAEMQDLVTYLKSL